MKQDALRRVCERARALGAAARPGEPMSKHTSFRIGGPAELYVEADADAAEDIAGLCAALSLPLLVVGNGSNLLISDRGVCGVVLRLSGGETEVRGEELICGADVPLKKACLAALEHSLSGLEFAYGIPGTVGGAVYMNAGAYGGEMKDIAVSARHFSASPDGGVSSGEFSGEALRFGYRKSAYTASPFVITEARLRLHAGAREEIEAKMKTLLERRKSKQPLEFPSAGSVFKRPEGRFAGTLIESCGLKGLREGGAMVSEKHAGFIVNAGGATCADVRRLIERIQTEVLRQTGIALECEIRVLS